MDVNGQSATALPSDPAALATDAAGVVVHTPVMRQRITELLAGAHTRPGSIHVDATLGMAGHATALLEAVSGLRLIGIDRDADALAIAARTLKPFAGRFELVQARFDELPEVLDALGIDQIDSLLADLGLSSLQIDQRLRGFAYATDAPLDMRMDARSPLTAADLLNTASQTELVGILRRWGEEPHAERIARAIITERAQQPFTTSARLVEVISAALPAAVRYGGGHPAKRTFQALRIEVNGELDALAGLLPAALGRVGLGGRVAVLSYHSLEDRLVKQTFAQASKDAAPERLPVVPEALLAKFAPLTRGAEKPDAAEIAHNPRAASARLRAVHRIRPGAVPMTRSTE